MDVTPQLIEQIEFSEKFRGYDPDQVDDFLERVGASLSELLAEADQLRSRVERAERDAEAARARATAAAAAPVAPVAEPVMAVAAAPSPAPVSDDDDIAQATSTLTLAKRTAEAAISEARAEAAKLTAAAQAEHDEMVRRAREDAEAEFGTHKERFTAEIGTLEGQRTELSGQVAALEQRLSEYRSNLRGFVEQITQVIDDPATLAPMPPLGFDLSAPVASPFYATGTVPTVSLASERVADDDVAVVEAVPAEVTDPWGPGSWSDLAGEDTGAAAARELRDRDEGMSPFDLEPTQSLSPDEVSQIVSGTGQHDRYLSELDAAVNAGARSERDSDDAMTAFFEGDDPSASRRFGRRR